MQASRSARFEGSGVDGNSVVEVDEKAGVGGAGGTKQDVGARNIVVESVFVEVERSTACMYGES